MKSSSAFRFKARLEEVEASLISTVIFIPAAIMKKLPQSRVRVKGTMNEAPFALAVQYRRNGRSFFIVSKPLRKAASARPGTMVDVRFRIVSDKVEIPNVFRVALEQDDVGLNAWKKLTPGLQRSLCHYVNSVKNVDSQIARSLLLIEKIKQGAYTRPAGKKTGKDKI